MKTIANGEDIFYCHSLKWFTVYFLCHFLGEQLQQGEDLAAAVNAAASEQNYEAEWRLRLMKTAVEFYVTQKNVWGDCVQSPVKHSFISVTCEWHFVARLLVSNLAFRLLWQEDRNAEANLTYSLYKCYVYRH